MNTDTYNIYCDESCHLEKDAHSVMVLGAIWCERSKSREIASRIRDIKEKHQLGRDFEMKWSKVSPAKVAFYQDVIDYFFDNADLHFRACVAHKAGLDHNKFQQDHDTWYYKMYFRTLANILKPKSSFFLYFDRKDTHSGRKLRKLEEVLSNSMLDFRKEIVRKVQPVLSHEVEQIQLADLLIGCVGYANRNLQESKAKIKLVHRVIERSGYTLQRSTLFREEKLNVFHWSAERG